MKVFMTSLLAAALVASLTACSSRTSEAPSSMSSSMSSSVSSSMSSSMESSSMSSSMSSISSGSDAMSPSSALDNMASDVKDAVSDVASDVKDMASPTMSTDFDKIGALGTAQVPWGPGTQVDEQNRTTASDALQALYGQYSAYFIAPKDCGKFYLTFDEGYENGYSPAILDVLKEKDAKAVFFVTLPFVKSCPELVQRMIDEGHIVGNHTNHHWNPTKKTIEETAQDISDLHSYMLENFDYEMSLYRPPEGAFSPQTLAMAQQLGYTTLLWSFAYADWNPQKQVGYDAALARTEKFIHEGAVYLLHAVSKDNSEILGELIDRVRACGLEVATWDLPYVVPQ